MGLLGEGDGEPSGAGWRYGGLGLGRREHAADLVALPAGLRPADRNTYAQPDAHRNTHSYRYAHSYSYVHACPAYGDSHQDQDTDEDADAYLDAEAN